MLRHAFHCDRALNCPDPNKPISHEGQVTQPFHTQKNMAKTCKKNSFGHVSNPIKAHISLVMTDSLVTVYSLDFQRSSVINPATTLELARQSISHILSCWSSGIASSAPSLHCFSFGVSQKCFQCLGRNGQDST